MEKLEHKEIPEPTQEEMNDFADTLERLHLKRIEGTGNDPNWGVIPHVVSLLRKGNREEAKRVASWDYDKISGMYGGIYELVKASDILDFDGKY